MKNLIIILLLLSWQISFAQLSPEQKAASIENVLRASGINVTEYLPLGHVTDGSVDYTDEIQTCLDANDDVVFPAFPLKVNVDNNSTALNITRNNQRILFERGSDLQLTPTNDYDYSIIKISDKNNITLVGPKITGDKLDHIGLTQTAEALGNTTNGVGTYNFTTSIDVPGFGTAHYLDEHSLKIKINGVQVMHDNGLGILIDDVAGGYSGTVTYHTGSISFTKSPAPTSTQAITCDYTFRPYEYGMGIRIVGSENIRIINPDISQCWGDGLIMMERLNGLAAPNTISYPSRNITLFRGRFTRNGRNAISGISVSGFTSFNTYMGYADGKLPRGGINFEPNNTGDLIENCLLVRPRTEYNGGPGIQIGVGSWYNNELNAVPQGADVTKVLANNKYLNVTIIDHTSIQDRYGLYTSASRSSPNDVSLTNVTGAIRVIRPKYYRTAATWNVTSQPFRNSAFEGSNNNTGLMWSFINPRGFTVDGGVTTEKSEADVESLILSKLSSQNASWKEVIFE